jgi:thioredoxin-like negative regulator of GroEL
LKLFARLEVILAGGFMTKWCPVVALAVAIAPAYAAENLKLNDHLEEGAASDKPTYVIIYGEGCFNSKRQARRTVELYERYKGKVQFAVVDMDKPRSAAQEDLVKKFYKGYIPHVTVLNRDCKTAYNSSGEVEESEISKVLDKTLK